MLAFQKALGAVWAWLKKAARWLYDRWYIPLFIAGIILGFFISGKLRRRGNPAKQIAVELEAISAGADARTVRKEMSAEVARSRVEGRYRTNLERLDEKKKEEARELRKDPEKLARFLVRAGSD